MIESGLGEMELAQLTRRRAIAEALEWSGFLQYLRRRLDEVAASDNTAMKRFVDRSVIAFEIAQATGRSEGQVENLLWTAETVQTQAPLAWTAFTQGLIDASRVREISGTINKLIRSESIERLDQEVVDYAVEHTVAELRRWLARFVRRVEAEEALQRAEEERAKRRVIITHGDDGMSHLDAYLPSHMAAAIERRLHHESRAMEADGRTLEQKRADLLVSWAPCNEAGEPAPRTDIAVVVPADVLAGATAGFAESADGAWAIPANWMPKLLGNSFWWRMLRDPVTNDILTIEYQGRYAPDLLKRALLFRDATCVYPGCLRPAWACDIDHVRPWPEGPTSAGNTEPKSRRHHAQKGHGCAIPRRISPRDATCANDDFEVRKLAPQPPMMR